jgi:acyl-CoA reductase-like NAD-dependent aldehyde dehydrogenase/uncharacterized protein (DUF2141 family)
MIDISAAACVDRAREAQREWARRSVMNRCQILSGLRKAIAAQRDQIVKAICKDTGKPPLDALAGDVMVTLEQMRFYEKRAPRILKARRIGKPMFLYSGTRFEEHYEPHGVVLIYAPSNYPFQLSVVPMVTALYAGNAVILKCSERTPNVTHLVEQLCAGEKFPSGLIQIVDVGPYEASKYVDARPDLVFFTGGSENGRSVAKLAANNLIPAVLELGGKDAAIVFADCNIERAVEGVVYGAFSNCGQVCVGIKRLYVERSLYQLFVDRVSRRIQTLRIGQSDECDLGRLQGEVPNSRINEQVQNALLNGARVVSHGGNITGQVPMLITGVPASSRLMIEETFGPVLCAEPFDSEADAIVLANATDFALSGSVWTSDISRGCRVATALNAGSCVVNDVIRNIANPHASFGGNGRSGYGRYHGAEGLRTFSRVKSVMISSGRRRREINWFPFTQKTYGRLNVLLALRHRVGGIKNILRRFFICAMLASIASMALGQKLAGAHLFIRVDSPPSSRGPLAYLVFASPNGFPNNKRLAARSGFAPSSGRVSVIDVGPLSQGQYAITVYQDVNGNHKLDTGMFGIPKEPVGASNNPKPGIGPPRYSDCVFTMGSVDQTISISLVHTK